MAVGAQGRSAWGAARGWDGHSTIQRCRGSTEHSRPAASPSPCLLGAAEFAVGGHVGAHALSGAGRAAAAGQGARVDCHQGGGVAVREGGGQESAGLGRLEGRPGAERSWGGKQRGRRRSGAEWVQPAQRPGPPLARIALLHAVAPAGRRRVAAGASGAVGGRSGGSLEADYERRRCEGPRAPWLGCRVPSQRPQGAAGVQGWQLGRSSHQEQGGGAGGPCQRCVRCPGHGWWVRGRWGTQGVPGAHQPPATSPPRWRCAAGGALWQEHLRCKRRVCISTLGHCRFPVVARRRAAVHLKQGLQARRPFYSTHGCCPPCSQLRHRSSS